MLKGFRAYRLQSQCDIHISENVKVGGTVITYYKIKDQKRDPIGLTRPGWDT